MGDKDKPSQTWFVRRLRFGCWTLKAENVFELQRDLTVACDDFNEWHLAAVRPACRLALARVPDCSSGGRVYGQ